MSFWNEIKEFVGVAKIFYLIYELPKFYLKPKIFFNSFFQKEDNEKVIQVLVYSAFLVLIGYISIDGADWRELSKTLIYEIVRLIGVFAVLIIANRITYFIGGKNPKLLDIVLFAILIKLLIAPFQILFFSLFVFHENYNYFFIQNLIVPILFSYYFVLSSFIFQNSGKYVIVNIITNIFVLNLFIGFQHMMSFDNYYASDNHIYQDPILRERIEFGKDISDYYSFPSHRILFKTEEGNISHFLLSKPLDIIARGNFEESKEYFYSLNRKMQILDSVIIESRFVRNQEFFKETKSLIMSIDTLMNKSVVEYTSADIEKSTIHMSIDSITLYKELVIRNPSHIEIKSFKLMENQIDMERNSYYAFFPLSITEFFTPIVFFWEDEENAFHQ